MKINKELYEQYGFVRCKNTFLRITEDVLQKFSFEKFQQFGIPNVRVTFAIVPLCYKLEKRYIENGLESCSLEWFEAVPHESDSKINCGRILSDPLSYISHYLLPFLERSKNCKAALKETILLETAFNKLRGYTHCSYNNRVLHFNPFDSKMHYMALKCKKYEFALMGLKTLKEQNTRAFQSNKARYSDQFIRKCELEFVNMDAFISRIEAKDNSYIENVLLENEEYTRSVIKSFMDPAV